LFLDAFIHHVMARTRELLVFTALAAEMTLKFKYRYILRLLRVCTGSASSLGLAGSGSPGVASPLASPCRSAGPGAQKLRREQQLTRARRGMVSMPCLCEKWSRTAASGHRMMAG
jgi:hypothetical protein